MSTSGKQKGKRKLWQFSLRDLIAITLIVALAIAYWQERIRRRQATDRLEKLVPSPFIVLRQRHPIQRYSLQSGISFLGQVYLKNNDPLRDPSLTATLLRAETLESIKVIRVENKSFDAATGKYSFAGTFRQDATTKPLGLEPGTYLVRVDLFENQTLISTGFTVLKAVNIRSKSD